MVCLFASTYCYLSAYMLPNHSYCSTMFTPPSQEQYRAKYFFLFWIGWDGGWYGISLCIQKLIKVSCLLFYFSSINSESLQLQILLETHFLFCNKQICSIGIVEKWKMNKLNVHILCAICLRVHMTRCICASQYRSIQLWKIEMQNLFVVGLLTTLRCTNSVCMR